MLLGLLAGRWDYQAEGLLDRTHLRFFTEASIEEMFAAAGLHVHQMGSRWFRSVDLERIQAPLAQLLAAVGEDFSQFLKRADSYQHIVRAVKAPVADGDFAARVKKDTFFPPVFIDPPGGPAPHGKQASAC